MHARTHACMHTYIHTDRHTHPYIILHYITIQYITLHSIKWNCIILHYIALHITHHTLHSTHYIYMALHYTLHITHCTLHITHYWEGGGRKPASKQLLCCKEHAPTHFWLCSLHEGRCMHHQPSRICCPTTLPEAELNIRSKLEASSLRNIPPIFSFLRLILGLFRGYINLVSAYWFHMQMEFKSTLVGVFQWTWINVRHTLVP